jgi:hypothetical protein
MQALAYKQRPRPFSGEVLFALTDDALIVDNGRRQETIAFTDIVALRLSFGYRNVGTEVFMARIRRSNGRTVTLTNLNWRGYVEYDSQNKGYTIFVKELALKIAAANPHALFEGGRPALAYLATALVGVTALGGFVGATIWGLMRGNWLLATLGILFLFPFSKQVHGMLTRNKPLLFDAKNPPQILLPPQT